MKHPYPGIEPQLELIMHIEAEVTAPVEGGTVLQHQGSGLARRRIIPITGGRFEGSARGTPVQGEVLPGGADFQWIPNATTAHLDARYLLRLSDGSHIFVRNTALRRASLDDMAALMRGESVSPERFRCTPRFDVEREDLQWMTHSLFVGTAARHPKGVELWIYELK
jgi:hypothetical protein